MAASAFRLLQGLLAFYLAGALFPIGTNSYSFIRYIRIYICGTVGYLVPVPLPVPYGI